MRTPKNAFFGALATSILATPASFGVLSVVNGDFETGGGANIADVTGWFDSNAGGFFEATWQSNAQTPNGTNVAVFSSFQADDFGAPTPNTNDGGYLYQGIGTADGLATLSISFDWGSPTDDDINRDLGMTVGVYAYDGVGGFVAGDSVDVRGGAGVTLLDSVSFTSAAGTRPVGGTMFTGVTADLDLSSAGSQQLFLRFNNYLPSATEAWPVLDNVAIVPEPSVAILGAVGFLGLIRRRR